MTPLKKILLLLITLSFTTACGNTHTPPPFGIQFHALTPELIAKVRSFRVMAFPKTIYRCADNRVIYNENGPSGFQAMITFDWDSSQANDSTYPNVALSLPSSSSKTWNIMVEAYDDDSVRQLTAKKIAHGCKDDIIATSERNSLTVIIALYPPNP